MEWNKLNGVDLDDVSVWIERGGRLREFSRLSGKTFSVIGEFLYLFITSTGLGVIVSSFIEFKIDLIIFLHVLLDDFMAFYKFSRWWCCFHMHLYLLVTWRNIHDWSFQCFCLASLVVCPREFTFDSKNGYHFQLIFLLMNFVAYTEFYQFWYLVVLFVSFW